MKKKTLSIIFALFISCTLFVACGKEEIVEVVAPIESVETVEPIETITEETDTSVEESTETVAEIESVVAETVSEEEAEAEMPEATTSTIEIVEAIDKTMYAKGSVNTRSGPSTDYKIVGGLSTNQEVKVTGQSKSTGWYEIEISGEKQFVSNKYLSDTKVEVTQPSPTTDNNSTSETPAATPETTPSSGTTPNGTKLGRDNMPRRDLGGGNSGGSGEGNNVIWQ